jgi:hypothetical protein
MFKMVATKGGRRHGKICRRYPTSILLRFNPIMERLKVSYFDIRLDKISTFKSITGVNNGCLCPCLCLCLCPCPLGCSDFHFFSYFWECLTFPLFLGTQEFRKCKKKTYFSSAVLSEFFLTFSKIYTFSELFKTNFRSQ